MESLLPAMADHFARVAGRLACFHRQEVQVESWVKGECLFLLERLRGAGRILAFEREVKTGIGRKKIDLTIDTRKGRQWLELKHWLIGEQKGVQWGVAAYVSSLDEEFQKFEAVKAGNHAWVLAVCTANPGEEYWRRAIRDFNAANKLWKLVPRSSPSEYPKSHYLGLLHFQGLDT